MLHAIASGAAFSAGSGERPMASKRNALEYIRKTADELAVIAINEDHACLAHIFRMAALEVRNFINGSGEQGSRQTQSATVDLGLTVFAETIS
jgi:hypothetical protein